MSKTDSNTPRTATEHRTWWQANTSVPYGYCWCGCEGKTRIAPTNKPEHNYVKGCPRKFIRGHQRRRLSAAKARIICEQYESGELGRDLAKQWNVSEHVIFDIVHQGNATARPAGARRTHTCNDAFFDSIDHEAKAYWLGFIGADGCVHGANRFSMDLQRRDHEHLERFCKALQASNPVKKYMSSNGWPISALTITSRTLVESLNANGIVKRKTFKLEWPNHIRDDLLKHYLRGYFDGDGSWVVGQSHRTRQSDGHRWQSVIWSIVGNEGFCHSARDFLVRSLNLNETKVRPHAISSGIAMVEYGGPVQAARIARFLYQDATVYLPRKRDKVAHLL